MFQKLLLIAVAGALGTLARYGMTGAVQNVLGKDFPWGTVSVNLLGCLLFGVVWGLTMESRLTVSPEVRIILLVGFMGGFTTFSSFGFEAAKLLEDSEWLLALGYMALQNLGGLVAMFVGLALGRLV
ncbi:MAG: fluoride efflux transporter CrcB [Thermoguttaceae bacterium]